MDDRFLTELKQRPPAGFEAHLLERLRGLDEETELSRGGWFAGWRRGLWLAAAAAAVAVVLLVPSLRVSAQSFLDLFRVQRFVAVEVDPARMEQLDKMDDSPMRIFGETLEERDPGPPVQVADEGEATARAGFAVATPAEVPSGLTRDSIRVHGDAAARFRVDAGKVNRTLAELGIADAQLPPALDGQEVSVRMFPSVEMHYGSTGRNKAHFFQAPSPELGLPAGVDRAELAVLALRVAGLPENEARRIANSVDLNGTVLLPLPAGATRFREVDVNGIPGLLIETSSPAKNGGYRRDGAVILWANGDKVYALGGTLEPMSLLEMARSVR